MRHPISDWFQCWVVNSDSRSIAIGCECINSESIPICYSNKSDCGFWIRTYKSERMTWICGTDSNFDFRFCFWNCKQSSQEQEPSFRFWSFLTFASWLSTWLSLNYNSFFVSWFSVRCHNSTRTFVSDYEPKANPGWFLSLQINCLWTESQS